MISYPRTAAEITEALSLGFEKFLGLLKSQNLRVNLKGFLKHFFQTGNFDDATIDKFNQNLLEWEAQRVRDGLPSSPLVYHSSGVRQLHGFRLVRFQYQRKLDRTAYNQERNNDFTPIRKAWLKQIARTNASELEAAGIPLSEIERMERDGKLPHDAQGKKYQVHHRIPLDDGGTNDFDNFILIRDDVEHRSVHGFYNPVELRIDRLAYGETSEVAFLLPPEDTIIYPNPPKGYVAEIVPNIDFLEIFHVD